MGYRTLRQCVDDLSGTGRMVRVETPVDPHLEMAEIQRRVFQARGPALYFANVKNCRFPMVSNLFGTMERLHYIFRDAIGPLRRALEVGIDPSELLRRPTLHWRTPLTALLARPKSVRRGPVLAGETTIDRLPQLVSWPGDGGPYVTLPQVYTESPESPGLFRSNLGMYRVQLGGGRYEVNHEVGLHYQIHRGIAAHHAEALARGEPLKVNIFIGGAPAMTVAAVMPLPENVSELALAGMLAGHRIPMIRRRGELPLYAQADFCITGYLDPDRLLPEGPFGDHLGYYSLAHRFPVMKVTHVYHRRDAVWPFTVVGRPPQEDSMFGQFVHELTGDVLPKQLPGIRSVHAVDEAGVHPLLLAVGSERYVPYDRRRRSAELHTLGHALLGFGQLSLAKFVFLAAGEDAPGLDPHQTAAFLRHVLCRVDWRSDLHFHTETTSDTLDYSAPGLNRGSKVVVPVAGPPRRILPDALQNAFEPRPSAIESAPEKLPLEEAIGERPVETEESPPAIRPGPVRLPGWLGVEKMAVAMPGILAVEAPPWNADAETGQDATLRRFTASFDLRDPINRFPLVVLVDDVRFATTSLRNFLWVTFTKSDPAADIDGIGSFTHQKHWGCRGALVLDARSKPHHAPPLVEDPEITRRVDRLAEPGGPLHGIL